MKHIVLALDGIADEPIEPLDGKTPLEIAKKPHLNSLVESGSFGRLRLGDGKAPRPSEELTAMTLLGYPSAERAARGPLAASAIELKASSDDWLLACRLVTVHDGKLVDPNAGRIGTRESAALFETLNRAFKDRDIRFFSGDLNCHVLSLRGDETFSKLGDIDPADPDTAHGTDPFGGWPKSPVAARLKSLLAEAAEILETHEVNKVRVDLNENPANALWVWGPGHPLKTAGFGGTGKAAVISSSDAWKGAARAAGLDWTAAFAVGTHPEPSDLAELAGRFWGWVKTHDWTYLHLSEMDRCSLAGDYKRKIRWIEAVDQHLIAPLRERLSADDRVVIVSGHAASSERRERTSTEAPCVIWGAGAAASGQKEFSEEASAKGGRTISGSDFFKKIN
jgi:2,3-bisphosphoglycerate-independent phosphoglycerate mutase